MDPTMPLRQRQRSDDEKEEEEDATAAGEMYDDNEKAAKLQTALTMATTTRRILGLLQLVILAAVILATVISILQDEQDAGQSGNFVNSVMSSIIMKGGRGVDDEGVAVLQQRFSDNPEPDIYVYLNHSPGRITLGPHQVEVVINNSNNNASSSCNKTTPLFAIRLVGSALVNVHLQEEQQQELHEVDGSSSSISTWTGSFTLPIAGPYMMDAKWFGCPSGTATTTTTTTREYAAIQFSASSVEQNGMSWSLSKSATTTTTTTTANVLDSSSQNNLFPPGAAWIWTKLMNLDPRLRFVNKYIWTDPTRIDTPNEDPSSLIQVKNALVSKHGAARSTEGFYQVS
jgi:hypothetical protein